MKNLPPDRFQPKVLFIWLAIVAAALTLFLWQPNMTSSPSNLTIEDVIEMVQRGQIKPGTGTIHYNTPGDSLRASITGESTIELTNKSGGKTHDFEADGRLTDADLQTLQKAKFKEPASSTVITQIAENVIPFVFIIALLYFLFVRQLRQAGRGAMSFGKSRAKLLTRDREKATFAD
ncbi:MAG: ATP-dependent zinc metalloprotease FtsH, partial [Opitutaceae bacterium]